MIHLELNRIASHLFWLGTSSARPRRDVDALVGLPRARPLLDLFEMSAGQRMHTRYFQVGGVIEDLPPGWEPKVPRVPAVMPERHRPVRGAARQERDLAPAHEGHRRRAAETLLGLGVTGPAAARRGRSVGPAQGDAVLRRYEHFDFKIPVGTVGDNYDRYWCGWPRCASRCKIVEQALDGLPEGPYITDQPQGRAAAAPRAGHLDGGADPPLQAGDRGLPRAAGRGLRGDRVAARRAGLLRGGRRLVQARARAHARPELREPAGAAADGRGLADRRLHRVGRDARPDPRAGWTGERPCRPRSARPRCPPRLGRGASTSTGAAGRRPRPGRRRRARPSCARRSRATWRATPTATRRRSRRCRRAEGARLVLAHGAPPGGRGDAGDARLPVLGRDLLRHAAHASPSAAATCTCAPASPATCATPRRVYDAIAEPGARPGLEDMEIREFECLGACDMAPMASVDGRFVGPLDDERRRRRSSPRSRRAASRCPAAGSKTPTTLPWR